MNQTLDEHARDAGRALRAAAELRPRAAPSKRTRPVRRVVLAAAVVVVAVSAGAVVAFRSPSTAPAGRSRGPQSSTGHVADLAWNRVAAPSMLIHRIVSANGHTYALGTTNAGAVVDELSADGGGRTVFRETDDNPFTSVNDLIGVPGGLVAVGSDALGAAAWRSTANGSTWQRAIVEQPPVGRYEGGAVPSAYVSISRIIAARGKLYAFGQSVYTATNGQCPQAAWTSTDGASFALLPRNSSIACGGSDATDGPAGLVSIEPKAALAVVDGVEHVISPGRENSVSAIASDDHGYVAVGATDIRNNTALTGAIWWSANGENWTRVVTASTPDPKGFARFSGVVHTQAGWIAVGYRTHPGADEKVNDAILWTSVDGWHWAKDTRDDGTFEQFAQAIGIGVTGDGFAIFGSGNVTGGRVAGQPLDKDPLGQDEVLWLGSKTPSRTPLGIVEGTMREAGGPPPGINQRVTGSLTATAIDGRRFTASVGAAGRFSSPLPPGEYHVVGHSPAYGNGTYDCEAGGPINVKAYMVTHIELVCPIR
jgi:hypothetical protein